jgi:AcrR family transcriptional regulator
VLFLQRGFDDVSVAEIAVAADVSKVTVFNYFPAKEYPVLAQIDGHGEDAASTICAASRAGSPKSWPPRATAIR